MTGARRTAEAAMAVAVAALLLPLAAFLVVTWLLGWQLQTVLSGSMAPTYPVGSLLVVGQMDAADVRDGMAIVFEDPQTRGRLVTHRVVGRAPGEELMFLTQGDANLGRDPDAVPARLIRGRVLWQVPHLGNLTGWVQWPMSFIVLVLVPGLLLLGTEWRGRHGRRSDTRGHPRSSPLPR